eukprot:4280385-Prymnesium_polylepis.1
MEGNGGGQSWRGNHGGQSLFGQTAAAGRKATVWRALASGQQGGRPRCGVRAGGWRARGAGRAH